MCLMYHPSFRRVVLQRQRVPQVSISPPSIALAPADKPTTILGHWGLFELHTELD